MHSGMLFSGADGSEGDENLAEVVLAHLPRTHALRFEQ